MLRICSLLVLLLAPGLATGDIVGRISVIDGDTIDVGDTRIRLFGIDAPERDQTCATDTRDAIPCGAWVTREVTARLSGRTARCVRRDVDRYGRVVATCTVAGRDIAGDLVSDGLAFAYRKYSMAYDLDEKAVTVAARGLHAMRIASPESFRRARVAGATAPPSACVIKGNISAKGARIFHVPGQRHYAATGINERKGERWFCSVAKARAAGWRPARR